ncbi:unnamed protein product [Callosobruchus maculatus]|uniref:Uncharacterized protein n=1 Tax=Callosobruchus maculatus TaxID=64391 RepID=A0A653CXQ3_CALMS|nr:unnamed protein product [Callosobruchus maculatus]
MLEHHLIYLYKSIHQCKEDTDSEVDEVQESDHDSDTEQEDDPLSQDNLGGPTFFTIDSDFYADV